MLPDEVDSFLLGLLIVLVLLGIPLAVGIGWWRGRRRRKQAEWRGWAGWRG